MKEKKGLKCSTGKRPNGSEDNLNTKRMKSKYRVMTYG